MKYTIKSVKYLIKNFWYLLPLAALPALFLCFTTDEGALSNVVQAFFGGDLSAWTLDDLFCSLSVLNFGSWRSIVFGVLEIIVLVPCVALIMAVLEKHFRIGRRSFRGILSKLNDNLLSTCGVALILLLIYEVWALLISTLLLFASMAKISVFAYLLAIVFFLGMHVVLLLLVGVIYLWLPCMQMTGFRAFEALHYSYQLTAPFKWRLLMVQMMSVFVAEALICTCVVFISNFALSSVLLCILYALLIMIFCVRMQVAYFDRDQIERADEKKYY